MLTTWATTLRISVYSGTLPQTITVNEPAGIGVRAGKIWGVHRIFYQENVNAVKFLLEIFVLLLVHTIFLYDVAKLWNIANWLSITEHLFSTIR